jgi:hypothetical protein
VAFASAGLASSGNTKARRRLARNPSLLAALCAALAVLAGCAAPQYGDAAAGPGTRFSAASPIQFGSSALASHRETADTKETEETQESAASGAENAPGDSTAVVPIVQSAPPAEPEKPGPPRTQAREPGESDMLAARHHRPDELVGLNPAQVTELLGNPGLVRRDAPAQIWQYRGPDCVLDLYLYPPAAAGKAHDVKHTVSDSQRTVVYYELRGKNAKRVGDDRCFISIIAARAPRSG